MISEIIPFWSKYWHYILISVATYFYVMWKSSHIISKSPKNYSEESESELPCQEGNTQ